MDKTNISPKDLGYVGRVPVQVKSLKGHHQGDIEVRVLQPVASANLRRNQIMTVSASEFKGRG